MINPHGFRRAVLSSLAAGAAAALALTAFSSTVPAAASTTSKSMPTLNIAIGAPSVGFAAVWIALDKKLFPKNGVHVNVVTYTGVQVLPSLLTSGRADLVMNTDSAFFSLMLAGEPAQVIFNLEDYNWQYGTVIARPQIKSIADLQALGSSCRLATSAPGTGTYGWMLEFQKAYKLHCTYIDTPTLAAETAAVTGGSADAAVTLLATAQSVASAGLANIIFDPSKEAAATGKRIIAESFPSVGILGLKSNLKAKKKAVTDFVKALRQADAIIQKSTPSELAKMTIASAPSAWGSQTTAAVAAGWSILHVTSPGTTAGFISAASWSQALKVLSGWGLTSINLKSPALSYRNAINMSFFQAAG